MFIGKRFERTAGSSSVSSEPSSVPSLVHPMRIRAEKYLSKASVCLKEGKTYPLAMYVDIVALDKIHEILGCE